MRRFSLKLGLATLALLLANTVQAATVDKLSCINNKSNGKKYTTTNGDKYSIVCSIDYVGGDIATTKGLSFEQCIEACQGVKNCVDVSYAPSGGYCYIKSSLKTPKSNAYVWTARKDIPIKSSVTCAGNKDNGALYGAANGGTYKVVCGMDLNSANTGVVTAATFSQCIDSCDKAKNCKGVSYVNGACYQKAVATPLKVASWVWTAQFVPASGLSCVAGLDNGKLITTTNGQKFAIICGIDYWGGDMPNGQVGTKTFEKCIELCDTTTGCVDVSFISGACYMKSSLQSARSSNWVWTARKNIPITPSCAGNKDNGALYSAANGGTYKVVCGMDLNSANTGVVTAATFSQCIDSCDKANNCNGVSYVNKACYQKAVATPLKVASWVWTAILVKKVPSSSNTTPSPTISSVSANPTGSLTSATITGTPEATSCPAGGEDLVPAIDATVNTLTLSNLELDLTANLNYAQVSGNRASQIELTMIYPQVTLEHSSLVTYQCIVVTGTTKLTLTFQSTAAFDVATTWPDKDFVLITNSVSSNCNPATSRGVYLVESYISNPTTLKVVLLAKAKEFNDVAEAISIKYGVVNGNKPTATCNSDLRPISTGTATATITTFAPGTSASLSPGAQEIYDFLKNSVKYDEDGNIIANIPPQVLLPIAVDEPDFNNDALQADLEKQLQDAGLTPPDELFKQGADGVDGVCPVPKASAVSRRRNTRSSVNNLSDIAAWDQRLSSRADGWEIACSDEVGFAAGIFGLDDAVGAVCAGKDLYDSRDAIRCLFTNCQTYYTTTIITYYYPPPSTKYNFEYSWSVKFPTLEGRTIVANGPQNTITCVNCGLTVSKIEFIGEIIVNITSGVIQKAEVTLGVSQVADLVMNLKSGDAWSGTWSYALSSSDLGPISVDKVFSIVPKMLYGLGVEYKTDSAIDVVGGAKMTLTNANVVINLLTNTVVSTANWQPSVSFQNPAFVTGSNVLLTPIMRTSILTEVSIFGIKLQSPSITSETVVGIDTSYSYTAGSCPAKNLQVNTYVSSKNSLFFGSSTVARDLSTLKQPNKLLCLDVPSSQPAPEDIEALRDTGAAFCTSYISYTPPTSVSWDTSSVTVPSTVLQTDTTTITDTPIIYEYTSFIQTLHNTRFHASSTQYVYTEGTASIEAKYLKRRGEIATATPTLTAGPTETEASIEFEPTEFLTVHNGIYQPAKGLWVPPKAPGLGLVGSFMTTAAVSNHSTTAAHIPLRRRAVDAPAVISDWPASKISYACKQVATGTATTTYTTTRTSTSGVVTKTVTATANVDGPLSTSTVVSTSSEYWGFTEITTDGIATVTTAASCPLQTQASCFQLTGHGVPHIEGRLMGYNKDWGFWSFAGNLLGTTFYLSCDGTLTMLNEGSRLIFASEQSSAQLGNWVSFVKTDYAEAHPDTVQHAKCSLDEVTKKLNCELWGLSTFGVWEVPYRFVQSWYADPWWPEYHFYPSWGPVSITLGWPLYRDMYIAPIWLTYEDVECPCDFKTGD